MYRKLYFILLSIIHWTTIGGLTPAWYSNPTTVQANSSLSSASLAAASTNPINTEQVRREFKGEVSNLFGNVRIPAALFAGASAGAAFAMPFSAGDGLKIGLVKRVYSLLMMSSLSSEILAVIVSTLAMSTLATRHCPKTETLADLLQEEYSFEWVAARWHFLSGLVTFILGIGLRAWITINCPVIAKAALGIILSSAFLCLAFIQETEDQAKSEEQLTTPPRLMDGILGLPLQYFKLLLQKSSKKPLFALAFGGFAITIGYTVVTTPHVIHWLSSK